MAQNKKKNIRKIKIKPIPAALTAGAAVLVLVLALAAAFSGGRKEEDSVGIQFNDTDLKNQHGTPEDDSQRVAATVEIQLEDCAVVTGTRFKVTAIVTPENTEQALIWSSSDTGIFEVDADGIVTVRGTGTAVLTATVGAVTDAVVIEGIQTVADGSQNDLPVYAGNTAFNKEDSNQASGNSGSGSGPGSGGDGSGSLSGGGGADDTGNGGHSDNSGGSSGQNGGGSSSGGDVPSPDNGNGGSPDGGSSNSDGSSTNGGAGSSGIGELLPDMGFSQVLSNVYVCEENGIYYGEIITQPNVTIMYIKRRGETFDARIQSVLSTLLPSEHTQVWNNFLTANTDRTFTVEDRKVRIVVAANGGHSQIVIYN